MCKIEILSGRTVTRELEIAQLDILILFKVILAYSFFAR